jgi:hypothetical protein
MLSASGGKLSLPCLPPSNHSHVISGLLLIDFVLVTVIFGPPDLSWTIDPTVISDM